MPAFSVLYLPNSPETFLSSVTRPEMSCTLLFPAFTIIVTKCSG